MSVRRYRRTAWGVAVAATLTLAAASCTTTTSESTPNTPLGGATGSGVGGGPDQGGGSSASGGQVGTPGGPVQLDGVFNARQTGGLTTADGQRVRDNVLIRSGALTALTATGCEQLAALGVVSVVDLRAAAVVAQEPDAACVASTAAYYNADLPKILPPTVESYLQTLDATEPVLPAIYGHLADHGLPAVVHCVIGRDRASMMMAILLLSLGVPQAQVVADFETNQETDVDASWLDGVLDRIEQAGGIDSYLASHGVTDAQLTALRGAALE